MPGTSFYNEKAEKTVIALIGSGHGNELIGELSEDDFYDPINRKLFKVCQLISAEKQKVDIVTISSYGKRLYSDEEPVLTNALIDTMQKYLFGAEWEVKSHVDVIKAATFRRTFYEALTKARKDLTDDANDAATVLDSIRQTLREMVVTRHAWMPMLDVMMNTYDTLERRRNGEEHSMPSGVSALDRVTTGFHRGELTIIGARPAVGKSALGAHIALSTAAQGYKVGVCSREMTDIQYGTRIIARNTDIDPINLRTGNLDDGAWNQISDVLANYSGLPVSFMFSTRYIEDLRMEVQKKVDTNDIDLLVVDYVQLLQSKRRFDQDYLRIAYVSKMLKDMTTDYNIAIIALAQVGRSSEGTMPTLAELRGSGDLEQDADNVIFMHKPNDATDKYIRPTDRDLFDNLKDSGMQYIALNVAKQRQGQTGTVPVVFNPARMRFNAIDNRGGMS